MGLIEYFDGKFYSAMKEPLGRPVVGQLVWVPVPQLDPSPNVIEAVRGRPGHADATCRWAPMTADHFRKRDDKDLPILHLGLSETEELLAFKAKKRPAVVLGTQADILGGLVKAPSHHEEDRVVVAPVYGIANEYDRKGFSPMLARRVRHLLYKQYFPLAAWKETRTRRECPSGTSLEAGIVRFDRLQFVLPRQPGCSLVPLRVADEPLMFMHALLWCYLHAAPLQSLAEMRAFLAELMPPEDTSSTKP